MISTFHNVNNSQGQSGFEDNSMESCSNIINDLDLKQKQNPELLLDQDISKTKSSEINENNNYWSHNDNDLADRDADPMDTNELHSMEVNMYMI